MHVFEKPSCPGILLGMDRASKILIGVVCVLAVGSVLLYYRVATERKPLAAPAAQYGDAPTTTAPVPRPDVNAGELTGKRQASAPAPEASSFPLPDLNRPVIALVPLSQFAEADARRNMALLIEILQKNPDDAPAWIGVGLYRKTLGDYEGAEEAWQYVARHWPTDFVAHNNLGNLYHEQLRDLPKAEVHFLKVVELQPSFMQTYFNLYNLYRYSYKEQEVKAVQALLQGLQKNPTDLNLMLGIARHYAETGRKEESAVYYKMATQRAETENKSSLAESLQKEARESGISI